jgi:hypothetical protein
MAFLLPIQITSQTFGANPNTTGTQSRDLPADLLDKGYTVPESSPN